MLEGMFGCALITKLRSILLMEADFNSTNKIIYGQCILQTARDYKLIPEEIYSERNCLADNGTLAKFSFMMLSEKQDSQQASAQLMPITVTIVLCTQLHP